MVEKRKKKSPLGPNLQYEQRIELFGFRAGAWVYNGYRNVVEWKLFL